MPGTLDRWIQVRAAIQVSFAASCSISNTPWATRCSPRKPGSSAFDPDVKNVLEHPRCRHTKDVRGSASNAVRERLGRMAD